MSDSDSDSDNAEKYRSFEEIAEEIKECKSNPKTSGMFVSGWDDADQDVDVVKDPTANPVDHILWAAENGDFATVKSIISTQPGLVHARDSDGYTPLHRAAYGNHLEVVSYLLIHNANVKSVTEMGWTPLHSACNWNNYKVAARLLASNADPTALSDGDQTPLHLAAAISHSKSTLLILMLREDVAKLVNQQNNSGETPVKLARGHGIYAPLFEMILPSTSYIRNIPYTTNPYMREDKAAE